VRTQLTNGRSNSDRLAIGFKTMAILLGVLAKLVGARASHAHLWTVGASDGVLNDKTPSGDEAVPEVIINYQEGD
jgi:hypothetical protein